MTIQRVRFAPARVRIGGKVAISCELVNATKRTQRALIDLRVHFVKANGKTAPKAFKVSVTDLAPGARAVCRKTISLQVLTTRKPYPGRHVVDLLVNGRVVPIGAFVVTR